MFSSSRKTEDSLTGPLIEGGEVVAKKKTDFFFTHTELPKKIPYRWKQASFYTGSGLHLS